MRSHRRAVILGGLHAGHLAVLNDQLFRGGAEHDLVGSGGLGGRQHGVHRRLEVGAPAARIIHAVDGRADELVLTIPERADQGRLGILNEGGTLRFEPLLERLAALDELLHEVIVAVNPAAHVRRRTQAAVVGLEDVQVDGGEQGQLARARFNLRLRPIEISLNLGLQILEGLEVLGMHAVLGQLGDVARHEFMILIVALVERLFGPVQDGLQLVQSRDALDDLVIGVAVIAHAGGRIRIGRIPYEVRHDALILTAGNQRVAADFRVLFDDQNGVAVLRGLRRRRDASAARADDDHIIGLLDRGLRLVLHGRSLEGVHVRAARLLGSVVHRVADRVAGEGRAGNAVHARAVRSQNVRDHRLEGNIAHVIGFLVRADLDGGHGAVGEGHGDLNRAVVALRGAGVGAGSEGHSRIVRNGFALRLGQRLGQRVLHGGAGHGRASRRIDSVSVGHAHQRGVIALNRSAAQRRGFTLAGHGDSSHFFFVHGHLDGHSAAKALRGRFILARRKRRSQTGSERHDGHRRSKHHRCKFLHLTKPPHRSTTPPANSACFFAQSMPPQAFGVSVILTRLIAFVNLFAYERYPLFSKAALDSTSSV